MSSARTPFSLLQAIAAVAIITITLWSLGGPSLRFAEAANVTFFSDTLSDSAPSVGSNHTFVYNTPNGVAAGGEIELTFPAGFGNIAALGVEDFDLTVNGSPITLAGTASVATWGVSTTTTTITFTSDSGTIASSATVTIAVGTNATNGGTGNTQITNPASIDSYEINLTSGMLDTGSTRVAIISPVEVTASVDTVLSFTVAGLGSGETINGTTTTGASSSTTIPFGQLRAGMATTVAQELSVSTNASNGFVVTVQVDGQLVSATGADIDGFANGLYNSTPTPWTGPTGSIGNEWTYGHWGITTNDDSVSAGLDDDFDVGGAGNRYVSASTTPVEVFRHDGPADGSEPSAGQTQVGYQVQITALQEAGDDYNATLTYVATPVF